MATVKYANVNKAADLQAQAPDFLPKLWKKGVEVAEQEENFFAEFEGTSPMSPIVKETDLSKGAGQEIVFRNMAGLYGDGKIGDEEVGEDAEEWRVGQYGLKVDYFRHATEHNLRTEDQTGLESEINEGIPQELGRWNGRKKTAQMFMMYRHKGNGENYIFANNKGSREALRSADTIAMDGITGWGQAMKTAGAAPAMVGKAGPNKILRYILVATGEALVSLRNSSAYRAALGDAGERGDTNMIFKGGYVDVDGHVIKEYNPIDHDGFGAIGSALNARAALGIAITAGTATFDITGGGSALAGAKTKPKYFEFFSNYQYRFLPGDILTPDTTDRYVIIYNTSGTNAGKWGFYKFVTNDGNKLVVTQRLGSAASGIRATTVGNVTWDAAKNIDVHPEGSLVIETNSYGVAFGRSIMLGAKGALRGYGRFQNKRSFEALDGDFFKRTYVTSIFGQAPRKRPDGRMPHFRVIEHAITYAGLNLPVVA